MVWKNEGVQSIDSKCFLLVFTTVTVSVTNNGGTADVRCVMLGNDGQTYYQDYLGIGAIGDDLWFRFTVDGSHLVFE